MRLLRNEIRARASAFAQEWVAIVVVLLIEGVIYTMLYAIELARAKGKQLRQKTREKLKMKLKNELYQDYRQFEDNPRNWNETAYKGTTGWS